MGGGKLWIWDLSLVIRGNTASDFSTWRKKKKKKIEEQKFNLGLEILSQAGRPKMAS